MPSLGHLIYSGVIPLVKMYLTIFFGYIFTRKGMFSQAATKSASSITINLALPALIFSSIVPSFTSANISALGSLSLLAIMYILIGLLFGLVIREVCYVPRNFWQGIVVATGLSNWSSLPTAVVMSITQSSPFNPAKDTDLGVSFASIFILVYHVSFWVCGIAHSLSWDYAPGVPQDESAGIRVSWREKPIGGFIWRCMQKIEYYRRNQPLGPKPITSHVQTELRSWRPSRTGDEEASVGGAERTSRCSAHSSHDSPDQPQAIFPVPERIQPSILWLKRILRALAMVVTPISAIVAISLLIALVEPLKALFVSLEDGPLWTGPDGKPPLAPIFDTGFSAPLNSCHSLSYLTTLLATKAKLIGAMSVPLTLFLLGVSFARMDVKLSPRSSLPVFALLSVCAAKMILLPIIGVFATRAMITGGLIHPDSKVQIFVAIFVSGAPSALNQLVVANTISDGKQDVLSVLLFLQYAFMPLSLSVLSTIALLLT